MLHLRTHLAAYKDQWDKIKACCYLYHSITVQPTTITYIFPLSDVNKVWHATAVSYRVSTQLLGSQKNPNNVTFTNVLLKQVTLVMHKSRYIVSVFLKQASDAQVWLPNYKIGVSHLVLAVKWKPTGVILCLLWPDLRRPNSFFHGLWDEHC